MSEATPGASQAVPAAPREVSARPGSKILDRHPDRRYLWLKVVVALGLASSLLLSYKTWVTTRIFPLTPLWEGFPSPPYPYDHVVYGLLFVLLVPIAVLRRPRWFIVAFAVVAGLLALWDQQRWQPWFYQYMFMLGALAFYGRGGSEDSRGRALNACRIVVVGIYLWSGLQKVNAGFVIYIWPFMTGPILSYLPDAAGTIAPYFAFMGPLVEICIGIGLITRRFRNAAVILTFALHAFILFTISPLGHNFNNVVWPWNLAALSATVLLFWRTPGVSFREIFGGGWYNKLVILLFLIMPIFHFANLWDSFLSATLYSGHTKRAFIYVSDVNKESLPPQLQRSFEAGNDNDVQLIEWTFDELNTPVFPENRVFENANRKVCELAERPRGVQMVVLEIPNYLTGISEETVYKCPGIEPRRDNPQRP